MPHIMIVGHSTVISMDRELARLGARVDRARTLDSARTIPVAFRPDAVLVEMSSAGDSIAQIERVIHALPWASVIVVSNDETRRESAIDAGASRFVLLDRPERIASHIVDCARGIASERALDDANRMFGEFCSAMVHDLSSPMITAMGFLNQLENATESGDAERATEYAGITKDAVRVMSARLEAVRFLNSCFADTQETCETDICTIAMSVWTDLLTELPYGVEPAIVVEPGLGCFAGGRRHLEMLLSALLSNAIEHGASNGRVSVTFGTEDVGNGRLLYVQDEGPGVERRRWGRIFNLFESSTERPGAGVGLALSKRIVAHYGGQIWLDQDYTRGTRVLLTLPTVHEGARTKSDVAEPICDNAA